VHQTWIKAEAPSVESLETKECERYDAGNSQTNANESCEESLHCHVMDASFSLDIGFGILFSHWIPAQRGT